MPVRADVQAVPVLAVIIAQQRAIPGVPENKKQPQSIKSIPSPMIWRGDYSLCYIADISVYEYGGANTPAAVALSHAIAVEGTIVVHGCCTALMIARRP